MTTEYHHSLWTRLRTLVGTNIQAEPRLAALSYIGSTVTWILPLISAVLFSGLIDGVSAGSTTSVRVHALFLGVFMPIPFIMKRLQSRHTFILIDRAIALYDRRIIKASSEVPVVSHLEEPTFLERLTHLRSEPSQLGLQGTQVTVLVWGSLWLLMVVAILMSIDPWLGLVPIAALPLAWVVRRQQARNQMAAASAARTRMRADRCFELATRPQDADEVRTLQAEDALVAWHGDAWTATSDMIDRAQTRGSVQVTIARLIFVAVAVAGIYVTFQWFLSGNASAGDVVLIAIIASLIGQQFPVVLDSFGRLLSALTMVDRYLWLLDYAEEEEANTVGLPEPDRLVHGIQIRDLTFQYPGADYPAVQNLSLDIPAGRVVALFGPNGCGKTTLIKLLTGMYRPTGGEIRIDGTPLAQFDLRAWRRRVTAAFQDFGRVEATLQHAVGLGWSLQMDDAEAAEAALGRAGAQGLSSSLDWGLGTRIGVSFEDGISISGGQWQQVALGRAMMRGSPLLLILDEPSASLDPEAEAALFHLMANQARETSRVRGGVTLLISHRLSSAHIADLIVVLGHDGVEEIGTHDVLVSGQGSYAKLYRLQASHYR